MARLTEAQKKAALFVEEVGRRANLHADWLDPKRRRDYELNPLLRALDTIRAATNKALYDPAVRAYMEKINGR